MANTIVSRRCLLGTTATLLLPGAAPAELTDGPQPGDGFVAVDARYTPLQSNAIQRGKAPILAWPIQLKSRTIRDGARFNQVLLLRTPDDMLVAFTAICPHAGCLVSEWIAQRGLLLCPCHGSTYDPGKAGRVVAGPSPLPLPTLPVAVIDQLVTVIGPFSARPGGHTTRTM